MKEPKKILKIIEKKNPKKPSEMLEFLKLRIVLAQNSLVFKSRFREKYFAYQQARTPKILENLCENTIQVKGKSTFKDEFVTAGCRFKGNWFQNDAF